MEKKLNMTYDYRIDGSTSVRGFEDGGGLYLRLSHLLHAAARPGSAPDQAALGALLPGLESYGRQHGGAYLVQCGDSYCIYGNRRLLEAFLDTLAPESEAADLLMRAVSAYNAAEHGGHGDDSFPEPRMAYYTPEPDGRDFEFGKGTCMDDGPAFGEGTCLGFEDDGDCRQHAVCPLKLAACAAAGLGALALGIAAYRRIRKG